MSDRDLATSIPTLTDDLGRTSIGTEPRIPASGPSEPSSLVRASVSPRAPAESTPTPTIGGVLCRDTPSQPENPRTTSQSGGPLGRLGQPGASCAPATGRRVTWADDNSTFNFLDFPDLSALEGATGVTVRRGRDEYSEGGPQRGLAARCEVEDPRTT